MFKDNSLYIAAFSQVLAEWNGSGALFPLLHLTAPELYQLCVNRLDLEKAFSREAILFQSGYHGYPEASAQQQQGLQCLANTASSPGRLKKCCSPGLPLDLSQTLWFYLSHAGSNIRKNTFLPVIIWKKSNLWFNLTLHRTLNNKNQT